MALAGLAAVLTALIPAAPAAARSSSGAAAKAAFGIAPAKDGRIDGRANLSYSATPGARIDDEIAVVNAGSRPLTLNLYATDATTGTDGSFALLPASSRPTAVGTWITLHAANVLHIAPRTAHGPTAVFVKVSLAFPQNASPGDHAGGIVVSLTGSAKNDKGVDVRLDQRVGLRVYARISGPQHAGLRIEDPRVTFTGPGLLSSPTADGTAVLRYRVHNTGNILLGATESADISGWLGGTVHLKGLPIIPPLLPGASITVARRVPGVFPGIRLTATVHLTATPRPGEPDPHLAVVSTSASTWALPWTLSVIALLLLGGLGYGAYRRLRPARKPPAPGRTSHRPDAVLARSGGRP